MNTLAMDLTAQNLRSVSDPRGMHQKVMSLYPDLPSSFVPAADGKTQLGPRAQLGVQFRVCAPGDRFAEPGRIVILHRSANDAPTVHAGDEVTVAVRLLSEARNTVVDERSGKKRIASRPVSDEDADKWVRDMLANNGMDLHETDDPERANPLYIGANRTIGGNVKQRHTNGSTITTRRAKFTGRDVTAKVKVTDVDKANAALRNGIGRGKNFGFGMLIPVG